MNTSEQFRDLARKYRSRAIKKGGILLFSLEDALQLAGEFAALGVPVLGLEAWYYVEYEGKVMIAEDPYAPDFSDLVYEPNSASKIATATREYIMNERPERIKFISFVLDDPYHLAFGVGEDSATGPAPSTNL